MKIELARTAVPNEMGPYTCGICEDTFVVGTVTAWAWGSGGAVGESDDSVACPAFRARGRARGPPIAR